jgi:hypothetical protein
MVLLGHVVTLEYWYDRLVKLVISLFRAYEVCCRTLFVNSSCTTHILERRADRNEAPKYVVPVGGWSRKGEGIDGRRTMY